MYLKLETGLGVVGWGEIDQLEPNVAATLARSLWELLEGENPTRIEHLWQKVYRSHRDMRGGPFMTHPLAGFDMALWDITGKLWGVEVYRLLGGPTRDKVLMYPTPKATKVGAGPQPFAGSPQQIERFVKLIENARKQVGPDGLVMFDAHCALPPPFLIQLAAAIQPYDILYIEEPAVPGNMEVFKRLKQQINIPLAVGEQARTIWEVIGYLQEGCADILQIDCATPAASVSCGKSRAKPIKRRWHLLHAATSATASLRQRRRAVFLIHSITPASAAGAGDQTGRSTPMAASLPGLAGCSRRSPAGRTGPRPLQRMALAACLTVRSRYCSRHWGDELSRLATAEAFMSLRMPDDCRSGRRARRPGRDNIRRQHPINSPAFARIDPQWLVGLDMLEPVVTPFPDVAEHVVQSERIGPQTAHGLQLSLGGNVEPGGVAGRTGCVAPPPARRAAGPAGPLPLRFGRQAIAVGGGDQRRVASFVRLVQLLAQAEAIAEVGGVAPHRQHGRKPARGSSSAKGNPQPPRLGLGHLGDAQIKHWETNHRAAVVA